MCRVLGVQRSGFYAGRRRPHSERHREDQRLLGLVKQAWLESGTIYGYRKITDDLRDLGESCGRHRVARLMRAEGMRAQVGYGRRPRPRGGTGVHGGAEPTRPAVRRAGAEYALGHRHHLHPDPRRLAIPGRGAGPVFAAGRWLGDAGTHAGGPGAAGAAVGRVAAKAGPGLVLHSDQGSQFTGHEWQAFLEAHGIVCSMSRRGNCHDNAVAESFFQLLKRERIKRRIYLTRDAARSDVFDYIEMFNNPKRRQGATAAGLR